LEEKMCEAHAFLLKNDKEEKILENVDQVEVEGDEVRMINIFGEQKILKARVKSYNGSEGKILFETL
jgi:predicted RNA-binding protein